MLNVTLIKIFVLLLFYTNLANSYTNTASKMCANFNDRSSISDLSSSSEVDVNKNTMKRAFTDDGNAVMNKILTSNDKGQTALNYIQNNMVGEFVQFIGPFVVGFLITLFIWPFLLCCCCCNRCTCCCRKKDGEKFTQCQLFWPSIVLIVAFLLIFASSIVGLVRAGDAQHTYEAVGCSVALTFSDVIDGNTSSNGSRFVGVKPLASSFTDLGNSIGSVNSVNQTLSGLLNNGQLGTTNNAGTTLLADISKIPDSTKGGKMNDFAYGTSFGVNSTFPNILGSETLSGSAIYITYTTINTINQQITTVVQSNINKFTTSSSSIQSKLNSVTSNINNNIVGKAQSIDQSISDANDTISPYMKIVAIVLIVFFSVFILLGILGIIGTVLLTFFKKYRCRYLIYAVCGILCFLGLITFLIAIVLSAATPPIFLACEYIQTSLSSPQNFQSNLEPVIGSDLTSYMSVCLPGESGRITDGMSTLNGSGLDELVNGMDTVANFNTSIVKESVANSIDNLGNIINSYYFTDKLDLPTNTNIDLMKKVADHSKYSGCSVNGFASDSWVPSLNLPDVPCMVNSPKVSTTQCPHNEIGLGKKGNTCYGCLDTTRILYADGSTQIADITARYDASVPSCNQWIGDMTTLWNDYYNEKKTKYDPIVGRFDDFSISGKPSFNEYAAYNNSLDDLGTEFNSIISQLNSTAGSVFNPQTGMLASLNCLVIGEDLNLVQSTACSKLFNILFVLRLTAGITAFGALFALCFSTCAGVRHYNDALDQGEILPNTDNNPYNGGQTVEPIQSNAVMQPNNIS